MSPVPRPWSALTGSGSPRPSRTNSQVAPSRLVSSTLLVMSRTGRPLRRRRLAIRLSSSVMPTVTSTTKRTASASVMAFSLWRRDLGVEGVATGHPAAGVDQAELAGPPVGDDLLAVAGDAGHLLDDRLATTHDPVEQRRLAHVGAADDRDDREARAPRRVRRWHRVSSFLQGGPEGDAVGGHDLDRSGQLLGGGPVEEATLRQADVGEQVAVSGGLVGQHPARDRAR